MAIALGAAAVEADVAGAVGGRVGLAGVVAGSAGAAASAGVRGCDAADLAAGAVAETCHGSCPPRSRPLRQISIEPYWARHWLSPVTARPVQATQAWLTQIWPLVPQSAAVLQLPETHAPPVQTWFAP